MIERDPIGAAAGRHDLLVVGGGVYGVAAAFEAARRGLRPLLVERDDFGGATSWNSLRIVHGGLRYLQSLNLRRFHESVGERSWFLREFPDLVRPIECLMPLYGHGLKRPTVFSTALRLNDLLSRPRNEGIRADRRLDNGRVLNVVETIARFPRVDRSGLQGAALWHDAVMSSSQRLIIELLHWACAAGAAALNYVEADGLLMRGGRVAGISAVDRISGQMLELEAPAVVNCTGPWSALMAKRFDREIPSLFRPSLAFNVFIDREPLSDAALAVAPRTPGGRVYFMHPWHGKVLAGTYHAPWSGTVDGVVAPKEHLDRFIDDINAAVPGWNLSASHILRVHAGLLPAAAAGTDLLASRETIYDHSAARGPVGLFSVSGVKFTTARLVGEKTARLVAGKLGRRLDAPSTPRPEPKPVLSRESFEAMADRAPEEAVAYAHDLSARESVTRLDDLLLRRTDWGLASAGLGTLTTALASLQIGTPGALSMPQVL